MRIRRQRGVTLVEVMIATVITGIVLVSVFGLMVQTNRMYANTAGNVEPQKTMMLAIRGIQADLREAMSMNISTNGSRLDIVKPLKDANGFNVVDVSDATLGLLGLKPGVTVSYFLGTTYQGVIVPAAPPAPESRGTTVYNLYRVTSSMTPLSGSGSSATYADSGHLTVVPNIEPTSYVPDPNNPDGKLATTIFLQGPYGIPTSEPVDARLGVVTLCTAVIRPTPDGTNKVYQTLQTQLCLRNMGTQNPGG